MLVDQLDLKKINQDLREKTPEDIIRWALSLNKKTIMTSSFGYNSAVSLHLLTQVDKTIPVIWIDSGYNVKDAYLVAEELIKSLALNIHVYNPLMSADRRNAIMGRIPSFDEDNFEEFTQQVKLEPFARALEDFKPEVWLTGIRQEETEHRKNLDIVTIDSRGILKVAPIFFWNDAQVVEYMNLHHLPNCKHYFDPTKAQSNLECGLHTAIS
jgi:phosphoadenosine phosphosulfate reductase